MVIISSSLVSPSNIFLAVYRLWLSTWIQFVYVDSTIVQLHPFPQVSHIKSHVYVYVHHQVLINWLAFLIISIPGQYRCLWRLRCSKSRTATIVSMCLPFWWEQWQSKQEIAEGDRVLRFIAMNQLYNIYFYVIQVWNLCFLHNFHNHVSNPYSSQNHMAVTSGLGNVAAGQSICLKVLIAGSQKQSSNSVSLTGQWVCHSPP